ncbi:MAG: hypothetical protein SFW66_06465 [Gammaproteobacteria bacterium]|nr:hypothetical protein [Gammaproteobacteria bacterium]
MMTTPKGRKRKANQQEAENDLKKLRLTECFLISDHITLNTNGEISLSIPHWDKVKEICNTLKVYWPTLNIYRNSSTLVLTQNDLLNWIKKSEYDLLVQINKIVQSWSSDQVSEWTTTNHIEFLFYLSPNLLEIALCIAPTLPSLLVSAERFDILQSFIAKIPSDACARLVMHSPGLLTRNVVENRKDFTRMTQYDKTIHALLLKLTDETANHLAQKNLHDCNILTSIANHFARPVFTALLNRLTIETCDKIALKSSYLRGLRNNFYLITLAHESLGEQFSEKLSKPVLYRALTDINYNIRHGRETALDLFARRQQGPDKVIQFINQQFQNIENQPAFLQDLGLSEITIRDGGYAIDSWSKISDALLASMGNHHKNKKQRERLYQTIVKHPMPAWPYDKRKVEDIAGLEWQFASLLGRTILMRNQHGDTLAIKIKKTNSHEKNRDFAREFRAAKYLRDHQTELNIQSQLPIPVDVVRFENVFAWLQTRPSLSAQQFTTFKNLVDNSRSHTAYIYRVNTTQQNYFTYLHDPQLSNDQYTTANKMIVHDLFLLLQHGLVFNQLADLYHNLDHVADRDDKGRYLVLASLLRRFDRGGSGRLTGWKESVEYPNVRGTGLADLGDFITINEFIGKSNRTEQFHKDTLELLGDKTSNYLIANIMAEYQYVLFLIAGRRAASLAETATNNGESKEAIFNIWQNHANQVIQNCVDAVAIITHEALHTVKTKMNLFVSTKRLARQMQFWMTNEYIPHVKNENIPADIYGEHVEVKVNFHNIRHDTFNDAIGFSINGKTPDLGPVNGQEPIKEANKLMYWMVTMIIQSYCNLTYTLNDLSKITAEKNISASEQLRANAFHYLPAKAYHRLQHTLCEERLASKQRLTRTMESAIAEESNIHKQTAAALTLQGFWRERRHRKAQEQAITQQLMGNTK